MAQNLVGSWVETMVGSWVQTKETLMVVLMVSSMDHLKVKWMVAPKVAKMEQSLADLLGVRMAGN